MSDVLGRAGVLAHEVELPVLGVRVVFAAPDEGLLALASRRFGAWWALERCPELIDPRTVRVELRRHEGREGSRSPVPVTYRLPHPDRLVVHTPGSVALAERDRGHAWAYVTDELVTAEAHFAEAVLATLVYFLVTVQERQPFHASAVSSGGRALLLHGPSGVGKSTLVWACSLRGLHVLSDDVVYFQTRPEPRVWGLFEPVRIPLDSVRFFPGLPGDLPTTLAGGREKALASAGPGAGDPLPVARRVGICLLEAGGEDARLERITPDEVVRIAGAPAEPGFDLYADTIGPEVERWAGAASWRLRLGPDPHAAAELVRRALAEVP